MRHSSANVQQVVRYTNRKSEKEVKANINYEGTACIQMMAEVTITSYSDILQCGIKRKMSKESWGDTKFWGVIRQVQRANKKKISSKVLEDKEREFEGGRSGEWYQRS